MFNKDKEPTKARPANQSPKQRSKDDRKAREEKEDRQDEADMKSEGGRN